MAGRSGASPTSPAGGIVVGVDESPGSLAALRWAIREGYVRGRRVHAVTAWEFPVESTFGDMASVGDFHPVIAAEDILLAALADADPPPPEPAGISVPTLTQCALNIRLHHVNRKTREVGMRWSRTNSAAAKHTRKRRPTPGQESGRA